MFDIYLKKVHTRVATEILSLIEKNKDRKILAPIEALAIKNSVFSSYEIEYSNTLEIIPSLHTILNASTTTPEKREIILKLELILKSDRKESLKSQSGIGFSDFVDFYFSLLTEEFTSKFIEKQIHYTRFSDDDFRQHPKELTAWNTPGLKLALGKKEFDSLIRNHAIYTYTESCANGFNHVIKHLITKKPVSTETQQAPETSLSKIIDDILKEDYQDIITRRKIK
ncbi:hypothetical protein RX880_07955 [Pseudomonas syringae pv. actinidiae]|nr:hypothetical protein [Pseudomonas syringae pv. actinidiae]MDU8099212.1 hypothetical protein [Pseudomonas syringae pv. actinidiae]MDU8115736.1 hypothetical protein [Pseudomonas syringae pv. actinidiae]MDU8131832.1 hypothetical protein [Pseudomonas syringae pv. actinidiae]MDU8153138.1 hypothetical protein [Pseudomonas syringae pv. actinidiae]